MYFTELELGICKLFKITLWADFVYVISGLTKLIFFIFFKQVSSLFDLQYTPFSILNLLDKSIISPLFEYPLSLLNLFELSYFLVLAWLLLEVMKRDNREISFGYGRSLKLITVSYGGGLLLWVVFVMFITINLT